MPQAPAAGDLEPWSDGLLLHAAQFNPTTAPKTLVAHRSVTFQSLIHWRLPTVLFFSVMIDGFREPHRVLRVYSPH